MMRQMTKIRFQKIYIVCNVVLLLFFMTACSLQTQRQEPLRENTELRKYREQLCYTFDRENEQFSSLFQDEGTAYCLMYTQDTGNTKKTYHILQLDKDEVCEQSRFSASLQHCQKNQLNKASTGNYLNYTAQCPGDGYLYLVGKDPAGLVRMVFRLFPEIDKYDVVLGDNRKRDFTIKDVKIAANGNIYLWANESGYLFRFDRVNHVFHYVRNSFPSGNNYNFVTGNRYYFFVTKGGVYSTKIERDYQVQQYIRNDRLTDKNDPVYANASDRIYVADFNGIMSFMADGCLWEMIVPGTDMQDIDSEHTTLLVLVPAEQETYFIAVTDNRSGWVKIYAYFND